MFHFLSIFLFNSKYCGSGKPENKKDNAVVILILPNIFINLMKK